MKLLTISTTLLLVGLVFTAPTSNDDTLVVTQEFFPESLVVYTAKHDIVNILLPLNALNFDDDDDDDDNTNNKTDNENTDADTIIFFVEADVNENGERVDQGLYMLKNRQATKLLDNGRDATATNDDSKTAYFAAKDGIYSYNLQKNKAEKYGSIKDDLISIAKVNGSDVIYVLTADHVLYKVTEEGTKKEKIDAVKNAKQIILDYKNNLFYYTTDKEVYALVDGEVKKIEGLPPKPGYVDILKPPFIMDNGIPVVIDGKSYFAYENGTSEIGEIQLPTKPTAYAMEATLLQYFGYNKKIYEYNILAILLAETLNELKTFLNHNSDSIQSIATRSRSDFSE